MSVFVQKICLSYKRIRQATISYSAGDRNRRIMLCRCDLLSPGCLKRFPVFAENADQKFCIFIRNKADLSGHTCFIYRQ